MPILRRQAPIYYNPWRPVIIFFKTSSAPSLTSTPSSTIKCVSQSRPAAHIGDVPRPHAVDGILEVVVVNRFGLGLDDSGPQGAAEVHPVWVVVARRMRDFWRHGMSGAKALEVADETPRTWMTPTLSRCWTAEKKPDLQNSHMAGLKSCRVKAPALPSRPGSRACSVRMGCPSTSADKGRFP